MARRTLAGLYSAAHAQHLDGRLGCDARPAGKPRPQAGGRRIVLLPGKKGCLARVRHHRRIRVGLQQLRQRAHVVWVRMRHCRGGGGGS